MRYTRFSPLHLALPVSALALGAIFLTPGGDQPQRAATVEEVAPRAVPSYLAASPALVAELDASLVSRVPDEPVVAREAALPDPSAMNTPATVGPATSQLAALDPTGDTADETQPDATAAALRVGDVAVNMRAGPSTSTAVIRPLQPGEPLVYGEQDGGWVSVTTASGETGWVYGTYLTGPAMSGIGGDESEERATAETPKRQIAEPTKRQVAKRDERDSGVEGRFARVADDVYLRAGPSQSTERLFVLPAGERVQIAETRGRWARVVLRSGASGWVRLR